MKDHPIKIAEADKKEFENVKKQIKEYCSPFFINHTKKFHVFTDASDKQIAEVGASSKYGTRAKYAVRGKKIPNRENRPHLSNKEY